ncbi:hypothetical protein FAUST_9051 [Fusarium austroamericanum]|uniref:NAD-dependent epimerase/dehydratase domain-containing protein n=1 Tax=Fusarium austroamericanum TaxID=282268 RepID=A0AAN5Z4U8_FUSAU|nr:hypothetical protein FAUST_9051 [Fusarium austroamericanum]
MSQKDAFDDGELPPPYTESGPSVSTPTYEPRQSVTTIFSSHLQNLPLRIHSVQAARTSARDQRDSEILTLLVPHVEEMLSSITAKDPSPRLTETIFVPGDAVGEEWFFSDEDESRTVVRVREDTKLVGDQKRPPEPEVEPRKEKAFDEWGRWQDDSTQDSSSDNVLWWSDHDMAIRLAKYISPERVDRQVVKAHVEQAKKSSGWGFLKKSKPQTPEPPKPKVQEEDPVTMVVKAEEVTFRKENAMGIWEGKTGWGLIAAKLGLTIIVTLSPLNLTFTASDISQQYCSSGHLGTALMLSLPSLGFTPLGIDILPSENTHHVGSISNRSFVTEIFANNPILHVLHAATLHKPHVESHSKQDFVDTNITGTLILLEEAAKLGAQIESFIFFSTTSTFGAALSPTPGQPAAWIDETVIPIPKNIYGATKVAAEDICFLVHKQTGMPVLVLRTSRFFPEQDDDEDRRMALADDNLKVLELAYRRCDMEDIVRAAVCAMAKAREIKFRKYIISAPPPFPKDAHTLAALDKNPKEVFETVAPDCTRVFGERGWAHLKRIDRVYDSSRAVNELGWEPVYTFKHVIELIEQGKEWKSELTGKVGKKGYHAVSHGVYTVR